MFFDVWKLLCFLEPIALIFDPTKKNNFLSKECPLLDPILKSTPLHCPENNGRGSQRQWFLCIVPNDALTSVPTLHPSGLLAHPIIRYLALGVTNGIKQHVFFLLLIRLRSFYRPQEFEAHPWLSPIWCLIPKHWKHQSYLVAPLACPSTFASYPD